MKLKPASLFLLIAICSLLVGALKKEKTIDINMHDTYFVIEYLYITILISLFAGFIAVVYFGLEKVKKPIKLKTGFWHFGLFLIGILILATSFVLGNSVHSGYLISAMLLISVVLLFISLAIFIFGLVKAVLN